MVSDLPKFPKSSWALLEGQTRVLLREAVPSLGHGALKPSLARVASVPVLVVALLLVVVLLGIHKALVVALDELLGSHHIQVWGVLRVQDIRMLQVAPVEDTRFREEGLEADSLALVLRLRR